MEPHPPSRIVAIEPFYGGSHKQLLDLIQDHCLPHANLELYTLPDKKWHWRARTSALYFAQKIATAAPDSNTEDHVLFCSSVLNLAELLGLRPDLARIGKKVIYFHENQLVYPVRKFQERDFQYGYNQITSALVADHVIFNSAFNRDSFLSSLPRFMKLQPDFRPDSGHIQQTIQRKSQVIYFPVVLPQFRPSAGGLGEAAESLPLHIVWPHRWEHDKNPDLFFRTLIHLQDQEGLDFRLSVLGQSFHEVPDIFEEIQTRLKSKLLHFGPVDTKEQYFRVLQSADVVVSTAIHEFFGVAVLEAAASGCYPLVPNRLAYGEIYPMECKYQTDDELLKRLRDFCLDPASARCAWTREKARLVCQPFSHESLMEQLIRVLTSSSSSHSSNPPADVT